jgi:hypothetical protein
MSKSFVFWSGQKSINMKKPKADSWLLVTFPPVIDDTVGLFGGPRHKLFGFRGGQKIHEFSGAQAKRLAYSLIKDGCDVRCITN